MQLVPITTKVVSSNTVHGEVYSIRHYVIKFVSFSLVFSTNKTDRHDITEISFKVALNTINQPIYQQTSNFDNSDIQKKPHTPSIKLLFPCKFYNVLYIIHNTQKCII